MHSAGTSTAQLDGGQPLTLSIIRVSPTLPARTHVHPLALRFLYIPAACTHSHSHSHIHMYTPRSFSLSRSLVLHGTQELSPCRSPLFSDPSIIVIARCTFDSSHHCLYLTVPHVRMHASSHRHTRILVGVDTTSRCPASSRPPARPAHVTIS
jgi:hypothetical protein